MAHNAGSGGIVENLDSYRPLICFFERGFEADGHTEYDIQITVPHRPELIIGFRKRYSDFVDLYDRLSVYRLTAPLPPKTTFGNKGKILAERQILLQRYLQSVLNDLFLLSSKAVKDFLYGSLSFYREAAGWALQLLAIVLRSSKHFTIEENYIKMGWRINKEFCAVRYGVQKRKCEHIAYWTYYGSKMALSTADTAGFLRALSGLQHPLFAPVSFAEAQETGCAVVRAMAVRGCLLDEIKETDYNDSYLQRTRTSGTRPSGLILSRISFYSRLILEALKFLHDSGIPYGNLTSRNVLVTENGMQITEVESGVCGLPSFYWPWIVQFRKINTFEAIDIYCFGHVLYEMVFGVSLDAPSCEVFPPECSPLVRAVLESILTPEACKVGMPTVSQLLTQPFFSAVLSSYPEANMRISIKLQESIRVAKAQMEKDYAEEQSRYYEYVKQTKVSSYKSSADEKQKRRLQTLKSQLSPDVTELGSEGRAPTPVLNDEEARSSPRRGVIASSATMAPPPPPPPSSSAVGNAVRGPPAPSPVPSFLKTVTRKDEASDSSRNQRSALLDSIQGFKKDKLSVTETNDKSSPLLGGPY